MPDSDVTDKPLAIFLMGPTASGKTALAIELSKHLPIDLISVDSALIYKGMNIGTAKPTTTELAMAPHALIDIRDPSESYSAADFRNDALAQMAKSTAAGRIPLLVGGTMLYFKALIDGLSPLPPANAEVRAEIEKQAQQQGWQALHDELASFDAISAKRIHPNDPQRLSRAIEVYRIAGKSLTELTQIKSPPLPYQVLQLAFLPIDRANLHRNIEKRFLTMLEQGFEQEVIDLKCRDDLHVDLPSIRCVGYRQMWSYLDGEIDYDDMVQKGIAATRQLAKRQITWLRGWSGVTYLQAEDKTNVDKVLRTIALQSSLGYK